MADKALVKEAVTALLFVDSWDKVELSGTGMSEAIELDASSSVLVEMPGFGGLVVAGGRGGVRLGPVDGAGDGLSALVIAGFEAAMSTVSAGTPVRPIMEAYWPATCRGRMLRSVSSHSTVI